MKNEREHVPTRADAYGTRRRRRTVGHRWKFLAQAGALFDASLDYETTLAHVVQHAVPTIADYAAIALVADDGSARWGYSTHRDANKAMLAERLRGYPLVLATPTNALTAVLRDGTTQLVGTVDEARLGESAVDATHLELLRELDPTSFIAVPLVARGRLLGSLVLCMTRGSGRRYSEEDQPLAGELGHRAALAVDNAQLYRAAEQARQAREAMVAVVAHDLKNPLSTVQMAADLLLDDVIPDDDAHSAARRHLLTIRRASDRMFRLVRDLLDVSAMEGGRLRLDRRPLRVHLVVNDVLEVLRPLAAGRQVEMTTEVPETCPHIVVDRERLLQVFANLGGNAIKFAPAGSQVTIGVATGDGSDRMLEFSITDTGPGMAPEDLPRIFEPYWRAARTGREGTGLGLTIAKGIVEAHGGRIEVTSLVGRGSTFRFTVPIAGGQ
jgi:signal transduction histidine kinase